ANLIYYTGYLFKLRRNTQLESKTFTRIFTAKNFAAKGIEKMRIHATLFLIIIIFLSACAVGPNYVRPPVLVSTHYKEAKGKHIIAPKNKHWKIAEPRDDRDRGEWWVIFHDPELIVWKLHSIMSIKV